MRTLEELKGFERETDTRNEPQPVMTNYFLGIGINEYEHWPKLNNACKDVQDIAGLLQNFYEFDPINSKLLLNEAASYDNIIMTFEEYVNRLNEDENLLIYYSGHGHLLRRPNKTNRGFWIPVDARENQPSDYLSNTRLRDYIADLSARHVLLISDSCFSGTIFMQGSTRSKGALKELQAKPSRWALCSGRHDELVHDGPPGENSPFAASILHVLTHHAEQGINILELVDEVMKRTREEYDQLPEGRPLQRSGHKGGQFVFRRRLNEEDFWQQIRQTHKLRAYQRYLSIFPGGKFEQEAQEAISLLEDESAWLKCVKQNTLEAYNAYLLENLQGAHREEAYSRLRELEEQQLWEKARNGRMLHLLHRYLNHFPNGKFAEEARRLAQNYDYDYEHEDAGDNPPPASLLRNPHTSDSERKPTDEISRIMLPEMVEVPRGTFEMGGSMFRREQPIHQVKLAAFKLAKYPVTFEEYEAYCKARNKPLPSDEGWGRGKHPVINVSWDDAVAYCNWLSEESGYTPVYMQLQQGLFEANLHANGFRLPTEAEWEYAARGGPWSMGDTLYAGGNLLDSLGWYEENSGKRTHPVGLWKPNELGLYDMSGNVYEWCHDYWGYGYYKQFEGIMAQNPAGPEKGSSRVIRGGGHSSSQAYCRVSYREDFQPGKGADFIGFRVAQNL
ncbi:MAG: hypothetical protein D6730_05900 [Bacteroidetes bacterium]|nr:MAG: hypothetical protein D6730_05900 [Bacteroidota bacterium]